MASKVKRCENPDIPWPGRIFYGGRWRTPERITEIRKGVLEYRENNKEALDAAIRRRAIHQKAKIDAAKALMVCERCGFDDPRALDLHHRDPSQKQFMLSEAKSFSWSRIEAEIAKCDALCANCHRILHAEEQAARAAA